LPEGVFRGLAALQTLFLHTNQLVSLPEGVFRGLTALQRLNLYNNQLVSLPEGVFRGLAALQRLYLFDNRLVSLPEGVFRGLTALQTLYLHDNPRLLVSYKDLSVGNNREFLNTFNEFFNYACQSPLARVYQLAAGAASPEAVREAFLALPDGIKNAIYWTLWMEAGSPAGDPQWGGTHTFEDMGIFKGALKRYVRERFEQLSDAQKNAVYGHVYHLARRERGAEGVDFSAPNWGEMHAFDNVLRLIDAMIELI
jgi:Leucine-rich repeat (LRR) protein